MENGKFGIAVPIAMVALDLALLIAAHGFYRISLRDKRNGMKDTARMMRTWAIAFLVMFVCTLITTEFVWKRTR